MSLARAYQWRVGGRTAERLLIAPQDLRTSDPTVATDLYAGRFSFAGKVVLGGGRSPFEIEPPSSEWAEHLHSFAWLRHFRASDRALSRSSARALVLDWIGASRRWHPIAWAPHVVSRRLLSWISHSPIILDGADHAFYSRFMRSLGHQTRFLRRAGVDHEDGYPSLLAAIALVQASLCMAHQDRLLRQSVRRLDEELLRQILPDGGHISRHPGVLIELLLDLLPLRQAFVARQAQPPASLITGIDRMMPMLRFFRLGDGSFAHFNGMGATQTDAVATILAYDDARGTPVHNAPHSGYQRLEADTTVVLVDAGRPPPAAMSSEAHAGCLSFEFACGADRIVVNCGTPRFAGSEWRALARTTAAHSTAVLNETSSCRFLQGGVLSRLVGTPLIAGPRRVTVSRNESADRFSLDLSHDGYEPVFGIVHRRRMSLSRDGAVLLGEDCFDGPVRPTNAVSVRFHLHPSVRAQSGDGSVTLVLGGGSQWLFESDPPPNLMESVFLAGRDGPRRTMQIVLERRLAENSGIRWRFLRLV